ncbi:hypothetical protein TNCV_4087961 [Trichonephila clavipes]|nr:hypothetical protein TNCV_4087961 [Trichonephila clavipes]
MHAWRSCKSFKGARRVWTELLCFSSQVLREEILIDGTSKDFGMSSRKHHIDGLRRDGRYLSCWKDQRRRGRKYARGHVAKEFGSIPTPSVLFHGCEQKRKQAPTVTSSAAGRATDQFLAASGKADLPKRAVCPTVPFRGERLAHARPVCVCPRVTRQHRTARLQWCREHHNWTERDWSVRTILQMRVGALTEEWDKLPQQLLDNVG